MIVDDGLVLPYVEADSSNVRAREAASAGPEESHPHDSTWNQTRERKV